MNTNDPQFWMMISLIVIAISFIVMAIAVSMIALIIKKLVETVQPTRIKSRTFA